MSTLQPLFGLHIDTVIKAQQAKGTKSDVPLVITELLAWLDSHQAITTANIFRALGHATTVQHIKSEFEDGTWSAANHPREDMHSVAAVFKLYLRELPDSLFPSKYYTLLIRIVKEDPETWQQSYHLRACLYALPKHNRDSLLQIINFLHKVANNGKENGVDASSLATIIAPYLLRPPPSNPPSPDKFSIVSDKETVAAVVRRFIEDAPFFAKTASRPLSAPEGSSAPATSIVLGRALYAYPGGSKWLLPLQKEDIVTVLDIKNEDGWVKVTMKGETGYTPLSYVQLVPCPPPSDDPSLRCALPSESEFVRGEVATPRPEVKQLPRTHVTSPHLTPLSPQFSSPDLSNYNNNLPPPPPIDFGTDSSIPPRIDVNVPTSASIPSPLSPSAASPRHGPTPSLSSSAPHGIPPPIHSAISPRSHLSGALSNSVPSLPALPTTLSLPNTPSKSASFNNSVLPPAPTDLPAPIPHQLPTKLSRAFSYSAPPPRLVAPQLPVLSHVQSPESERSERSERSEHDDETEETDYETDDFEGSHEDLPPPIIPPPAPPALPPAALINSMSSNDLDQDAVILKKRKERAEETLSTERTYVKQLTVVYDCFVEPLKRKEREKAPILNGTEIFAIFSNIEVILNCHRKLLDTMEKRMLVWDSIPELGDIFLENTGFIKLYKYYVNNFDKSIITLKACREKNPEFQKFAADLDYTEKLSMLSVESFLILPVQRIPRYVLLLQDLLKYTSPSHRDFNNLSNALSFIKDLADFINSNKSDADNINKILGIQEQLIDTPEEFTLVVPRRRYIEEGAVLYKKKKAWVYLFSDALLFTKQEKKGKRYKTLINLPTASLNITDEPGMLKIISTEGTFRFTAETPKEREHWIKSIRDTMDASRVDMLHSAFNDGNQTEGSNKQFMKLREEENAAKKKTLVDRLLENEQQYVESIQYIKNTFIAPLRKAVDSPMPMIALAELIDITSNLETLISCHVIFAQSIKERVAEWESKPFVDDLFTEKAAFLKLYNYYVSNHHKSLETIDQCIEKYPLFAVFLRELESREKVELKVLLQEPLRRVSSYYLTVQEMSQYLKPRTDEYDAIAKVVVRLKEQTEKLNADLHATSTHGGGKKGLLKGDKNLERGKSSRKFRMSNNKESK